MEAETPERGARTASGLSRLAALARLLLPIAAGFAFAGGGLVGSGRAAEETSATGAPNGHELYSARCAACHDHAAEQTPPKAVLATRSSEFIVDTLLNGKMRAMVPDLSRPQAEAVAAYLVSLRRGSVLEEPKVGANPCKGPPRPFAIGPKDWNGFSPDLANTRLQTNPGFSRADVAHLKPKWVFAYSGTRAAGPPSVVGGRVFVGSLSGAVVSLDVATGCTYWTVETGAIVKSAVIVGRLSAPSGGKPRYVAYFGDANAKVFAVDAETGEKLWTVKADDHPLAAISGSPTLADGHVFVPISGAYEGGAATRGDYGCCTERGSLVALDAASGAKIWQTYTISEAPHPFKKNARGVQMFGPAGASIWSPPTIDPLKPVVYVTTGQSRTDVPEDGSDAMIAIDRASGARLWSAQGLRHDTWLSGCDPPKPQPNCPSVVAQDADFGSPAILRQLANGRRILVSGQKNGMIHAIDPDAGGKVLWTANLAKDANLPKDKITRDRDLRGVVFGLAADGRRVYAAVADPSAEAGHAPLGVYAMDLRDGRILWRAPGAAVPSCSWGATGCTGAQRTAVTLIPGVVFAGSANGHMRAYDAATGRVLWDYDTARKYPAVNGVQAQGGSIEGVATVAAEGDLFVMSGYASYGGGAGNALIAFAPEPRRADSKVR